MVNSIFPKHVVFCCLYVQYFYNIKRRNTITLNWWLLGHRWQEQYFFSFGVFTLFPTWPIPKTFIDSITIHRARLTPCPFRKWDHPIESPKTFSDSKTLFFWLMYNQKITRECYHFYGNVNISQTCGILLFICTIFL